MKIAGIVVAGFLAAAAVMTGCAPGWGIGPTKMYQSEMGPLNGKSAEEVLAMVIKRWELQPMAKWDGIDPTPTIVLAHNNRWAAFSRLEAEEIFKDKGHYEVMIFVDRGVRGSAHVYDPTPGMFHAPDTESHGFTRHIVARLVFRDKRLHAYRFFRFNTSG